MSLYDRQGRAVAWFDDEQENPAIYLYSGRPVAWISDESIYAFSGAHLGWFIDGWIRDPHGHAVFFTPDCGGGPARPARHARPARGGQDKRDLLGGLVMPVPRGLLERPRGLSLVVTPFFVMSL